MAVAFEQLVFAWSRHGLERSAGFQVTAATPKLRNLIGQRHRIVETAVGLAGWECSPTEDPATVFGWHVLPSGTFVWLKRKVAKTHWAGTGSHLVHVFHTFEIPTLTEVCALIGDDRIAKSEGAAEVGTELPPVPSAATVVEPSDQPEVIDLARLIMGIGLTRQGQSAAAVVATSGQMIAALRLLAVRCPLPILVDRNLTTSAPYERMSSFAISGAGPGREPGGRTPPVPTDVLSSMPEQTQAATAAAITDPGRASSALHLAGASSPFNTRLFEGFLLFLSGHVDKVDAATTKQILRDELATDQTFELERPRQHVITMTLRDFPNLGADFVHAAANHPQSDWVAADLATQMLDVGTPRGIWPALRAQPGFAHVVAQEVVRAAERSPTSNLDMLPAQILMAMLQHVENGSALRSRLVELLIDKPDVTDDFAQLPHRDAVELLWGWWKRRRWDSFENAAGHTGSDVLASLHPVSDAADGELLLIDTVSSVGVDLLRTMTWAFATLAPAGRSMCWACERLDTEFGPQNAFDVLAARLDRTLLETLEPSYRRRLADASTSCVAKLISLRVRSRHRAKLTAGERDLMWTLESESLPAAQMLQIATWGLTIEGVAGAHGWSRKVAGHCATLSIPLTTSAMYLLIDAALNVAAFPDDVADIVGVLIETTGMEAEKVWKATLDVCDTILVADPFMAQHNGRVFAEALDEGVDRRHFGSTPGFRSPPKNLRSRADRWGR